MQIKNKYGFDVIFEGGLPVVFVDFSKYKSEELEALADEIQRWRLGDIDLRDIGT